jgi:hypothetical protein
LFPPVGELLPIDHVLNTEGRWRTNLGRLLVHFSNIRGNRILELFAAGADVFHSSQHLQNPPRRSTALTSTIYDMTCWLLPDMHSRANVEPTKHFAARVLRRAAACLAVSECARRDATEILRFPEDRITVIYPGIADAFFSVRKEDAAAAAARLRPPGGVRYLGMRPSPSCRG